MRCVFGALKWLFGLHVHVCRRKIIGIAKVVNIEKTTNGSDYEVGVILVTHQFSFGSRLLSESTSGLRPVEAYLFLYWFWESWLVYC